MHTLTCGSATRPPKRPVPRKYARDIAAEMGISEAELTAARLGHDAVRLSDDARALIAALERVGEPNASAATSMPCMSRWASSRTSTSAATPGWC